MSMPARRQTLYDLTLLTPKHAGLRLGVSSARIVQLEREGKLRALRDSDGNRLFFPEDVEAVARARESRR